MTHGKRPWWRATTTPGFAFVQSGLFAVLAAYQWITLATGGAGAPGGVPARVTYGVVATVGAVVSLVAAVQRRRHERNAADREADVPPA